jgi:serpin B
LLYPHSDLAMWILVPRGATTPGELLNPKVLAAVGSHLSEQEIDLSLPRWDSGPEPLRRHLPRHITVDEHCTEAGAVTGTAFIAVCGRCGPPAVRADHPFAFAIVHRPTKTPLFISHVADPTDTTEAARTQN